jgi:DNA-binding response OmpR family regulator
VPDVLIASDAAWVREDVRAAIEEPGTTIREVTRGYQVAPAVRERTPDIAILDLQIGTMGGMAVCMDLRLEEGAGRLPQVRVLMLLDRRADVFLARRSQAEGWIVKPLDPMRLRRAIETILAGGTFEDDAYLPPTVPLPAGPQAHPPA